MALQARERERYLAERAIDQFANTYYSELSATHYIATAAANAPFGELKKCCLFQLADEQRHLEMDTEVFQRAGIPELDWLPAWGASGTTCRFFRRLLELDDTFETLVKANFVAEGAAGPGRFAILADGAEARGDMFSALNSPRACATRHATSASCALVKALIEDDPAGRAPPRRLAPPHPPRPRSGRLAARPDPPGVPLAGAPPPRPSVRSLTASPRQRRMARGQRVPGQASDLAGRPPSSGGGRRSIPRNNLSSWLWQPHPARSGGTTGG